MASGQGKRASRLKVGLVPILTLDSFLSLFYCAQNSAPEAAERFRAAAVAFEILGDPERKAVYDRSGGHDVGSSTAEAELDPYEVFDKAFGNYSLREVTTDEFMEKLAAKVNFLRVLVEIALWAVAPAPPLVCCSSFTVCEHLVTGVARPQGVHHCPQASILLFCGGLLLNVLFLFGPIV